MRKLKTTLTHMAEMPASASFKEGEDYVCAVCELPVKPCNADDTKRCAHMILEGTELHLLQETEKAKAVFCIRCGSPIPHRILKINPLTELCPGCQKTPPKKKSSQRLKGVPR